MHVPDEPGLRHYSIRRFGRDIVLVRPRIYTPRSRYCSSFEPASMTVIVIQWKYNGSTSPYQPPSLRLSPSLPPMFRSTVFGVLCTLERRPSGQSRCIADTTRLPLPGSTLERPTGFTSGAACKRKCLTTTFLQVHLQTAFNPFAT
uniref:uncharacterized protein LOC125906473 n=1 Tax=Anopheles coluzzii TaxID=1518534 RepID=UPI0020FFB6BF|nr:uncharacterized protein LOC125906473 [Anopheles coluzzii]